MKHGFFDMKHDFYKKMVANRQYYGRIIITILSELGVEIHVAACGL